MRFGNVRLVSFLACLGIAASALAQYGHPLAGSWSGDWGPNKDKRERVLVQMHWDGKQIIGAINPGASGITLKAVTIVHGTEAEPGIWTVKMEGEGKDSAGKAVTVVVDGKLENIGSANRLLTGTWTQSGVKGNFRLTRN